MDIFKLSRFIQGPKFILFDKFSKPYFYSRPYVYISYKIFQALHFPALRLFLTLEYFKCDFEMVLTPFCGVTSWFNDMAVDKENLRDL